MTFAGDEISPEKDPDDDALIAAGFIRLGPVQRQNGILTEPFDRNAVLTDMTNTMGAVVLGVTLGCARCHDHKFDPIRQSDYYRMQVYFAALQDSDVLRATMEEVAAWKAKAEPLEKQIAELKEAMRKLRGMPDAAEQREKMAKRLEELQQKAPEPLPTLFSIRNNPERGANAHPRARKRGK